MLFVKKVKNLKSKRLFLVEPNVAAGGLNQTFLSSRNFKDDLAAQGIIDALKTNALVPTNFVKKISNSGRVTCKLVNDQQKVIGFIPSQDSLQDMDNVIDIIVAGIPTAILV